MAYCTQNDLLERVTEDDLVQLTDDQDQGVVDVSVVARAIADADAEIDGYCGTRYDVPFSPVPVMIRKLSVDIAIHNLFARRRRVSEVVKQAYDVSVKFLEKVSKGLISLGGDAPGADSDSGPEATTAKSDRIFTTGRASDGSSGSLDNY